MVRAAADVRQAVGRLELLGAPGVHELVHPKTLAGVGAQRLGKVTAVLVVADQMFLADDHQIIAAIFAIATHGNALVGEPEDTVRHRRAGFDQRRDAEFAAGLHLRLHQIEAGRRMRGQHQRLPARLPMLRADQALAGVHVKHVAVLEQRHPAFGKHAHQAERISIWMNCACCPMRKARVTSNGSSGTCVVHSGARPAAAAAWNSSSSCSRCFASLPRTPRTSGHRTKAQSMPCAAAVDSIQSTASHASAPHPAGPHRPICCAPFAGRRTRCRKDCRWSRRC